MAIVASIALAGCSTPVGTQAEASASVAPIDGGNQSTSPSPTPSDAEPSPSPTPAPPGEGDDGAWVNGYILPGSDDVHFGPEWGPTWYFDKTIGEDFADWTAGAAAVDAMCPWVAVLTSAPESELYSIALGNPSAANSTALIFTMGNPGVAGAPRPANAEGLGVGSMMDDVLAAYPGTTVEFFNDEAWGDVYEIDAYQPATDTHMFFWSWEPHGEVQEIQWGHFPWGNSWRGHRCAG
jgi:hypothetical protein